MKINYTTGYAGTGKSTALLELLDTLNPDTSVCLAPTHKALNRLSNATTSLVELKTIHALLGWVPGINEEATRVEHIDYIIKLERDITEYDTIVIDEAGMMSEEMLMAITGKLEELHMEANLACHPNCTKNNPHKPEEQGLECSHCGHKIHLVNESTDHITLHLFLDPYQLLPVKGIQVQTDPYTTTNLTTQHRAESPDVVALFTKFVNYLEGSNVDDLTTPLSENVIEASCIKGFKHGDRLLAYTNNTVGRYNKAIAAHLGIYGYAGQEVQLGNMTHTIHVEKYIEPTLDQLVNLYTSGVLKLQNSQINKKFLGPSLQAMISHKEIKFIACGMNVYPVVEGIANAYEIRNLAKDAAVKDKKNFKWVYALNRAFTMDYTFASTVHKAQGSEFSRVWIDKEDIQKSIFGGSYKNYARLMYVAISRAKNKVFIL